MYKLALGIEYVGTNYSGWQRQVQKSQILSVQAEIERAISYVANHEVSTICAGRTDAGVHAYGQVVHCEVMADRSMHGWVFGCNSVLPRDIRVLWAKIVPEDFDARRSAIARQYKYIVYNSKMRPGLLYEYLAWHYRALDAEKMHVAAQDWLGVHDFSSFRSAGCQSLSPVRDMLSIQVSRSGEFITFDITANAFLYHMIRNMVGVLFEIGGGKKPVAWAKEVLAVKNRSKASITAPAQGLYLAGVRYPERFQIVECKSGLWFFNQG